MSVGARQSKSIPLIYGGIAGVLLIVIAALALVFVPPSPPQVAEFAPQAQEQIEDAPNQQSSQFGSGGVGSCVEGQICEGPQAGRSAQRSLIEKARVRRCVGDPPRQTEDPQSSPCVNYFEGDNGGATSKGVNRDEIRVAVPCYSCDESLVGKIVGHFNRRYELYGRTIRPLFFRHSEPWGQINDPVLQRAYAEKSAEEFDAFASLGLWHFADSRPYQDELARRKVISVNRAPGFRTEDRLRRNGPFNWSFGPALDDLQRNVAEFACKSLVGRSANYGGTTVGMPRKFVVLLEKSPAGLPDSTEVVNGLERCDERPRIVEAPDDQESGQAMFTDFRLNGFTTMVCICSMNGTRRLMGNADAVQYEPEWLLLGIDDDDEQNWSVGTPPSQRSHMFGPSSVNKLRRVADEPWLWATKESDPRYEARSPSVGRETYEQLLLLVSGIQMAGARLTPNTFETGLRSARFPNPGAGQAPYWQASVGFATGYTFINDLALWWWDETSPSERSATSLQGQFCYVDRGARWSTGRWPQGEQPLFDRTQPCR